MWQIEDVSYEKGSNQSFPSNPSACQNLSLFFLRIQDGPPARQTPQHFRALLANIGNIWQAQRKMSQFYKAHHTIQRLETKQAMHFEHVMEPWEGRIWWRASGYKNNQQAGACRNPHWIIQQPLVVRKLWVSNHPFEAHLQIVSLVKFSKVLRTFQVESW